MDPIIMETLTGVRTCVLDNETDLNKSNPSTFTATISGAEYAYSLFPGSVIYVGFYKGMGTVAVSVSNYEIARYLNLTQIDVNLGDNIKKGRMIGSVSKKTGLQFEYATQYQGSSVRPIRIQNRTFFKQNPIDVLNRIYAPVLEQDVQNARIMPSEFVQLTPEQQQEFAVKSALPMNLPPVDPDIVPVDGIKDVPPEMLAMLSDNGRRPSQ